MAVSDADILAYVQANINDPGAIAAAAAQYGVSLDDLSRATGYSAPEVSNYFQQAQIDTSGFGAPVAPVEPTPLPEPQSYTPPEPPAPPEPTYYAPPEPTPVPQVLPEPAAPSRYNISSPEVRAQVFSGGGGRVLEDTQTFNDVDDFGQLDYYSQPTTVTPQTPPP